ncbi:unnamed protein product, partial [Chrysoparadoxa australica]
LVAAAYGSGHVRLYNAPIHELTVEIAAHGRICNSIDLHPTKPLLVSAGEDCRVNVWSLPDNDGSGRPEIGLVYSDELPNALITGARFITRCEPGGPKLGAVAYDMESLIRWEAWK